jgi:hypothetical protein
MVKQKASNSRSPGKPRPKSSHAGGKKSGRVRRKVSPSASEAKQTEASDVSEDHANNAPTIKIPARIVWDKYPERTERLLDFLDAHADVAIKLFGDSTQAAKLEGRSKMTAKSNKAAAYLQVADGIFSIDEDEGVRADFATNPTKYAKAVDNYIANT